jgi:hypothetical protein
MSSTYCSSCGKPLPASGTFCPSCGAPIPGATPATSPSPPPAGFAAYSGYGAPGMAPGEPVPSPATRSTDAQALGRAQLAAILILISSAVGLVTYYSGFVGGHITASTSPAGTTLTLPSPFFWVALIGVGAVVGFAEIVLFRLAFRGLANVDQRFATPATLTLVEIIGLVLALIGVAVALDALYMAVSCSGAGQPLLRSCIHVSVLLGGVALALIGALVALVGFIGMLLGIWRLGRRYEETLFKVGAILIIFPFLNFVGAILILLGTRSARRKLDSMAGSAVPPAVV